MTILLLIIYYRMVAAYPGNEVGIISRNILGLTAPQVTALSNNSWQTIIDFEGYSTDDVKEWITNFPRVQVNRRWVVIPSVRGKRIIDLAYWVNHLILRGLVSDPNNFLAPE